MKLSSEMVAMPVTLQTGEKGGRCYETYRDFICTYMRTWMLYINKYVCI